jgi:hypothetical protein
MQFFARSRVRCAVADHWLLATGFWRLVTGYWPLSSGRWLLVTAHLFLAVCLWFGQQQEASSQKLGTLQFSLF